MGCTVSDTLEKSSVINNQITQASPLSFYETIETGKEYGSQSDCSICDR